MPLENGCTSPEAAAQHTTVKISTKITLTGTALVVLSTVAFVATLLFQRASLQNNLTGLVREQAVSEAAKVVETTLMNCESVERRNQARLTHDLNIARELVLRAGNVSIGTEVVDWKAINQITRDSKPVQLPKLLLGQNWLGQTASTNQPVAIVDDVKHFTRDFCTLFQRMNDDGDMLRVGTSVLTTDGSRAIGTYIPRRNPDGTLNPVLDAVLSGKTYRGRAFVVNDYHATAYEPIWNVEKTRVIGMLYVGIGMGQINKELQDSITKLTIGKNGSMFVLGGKGDLKGKYIVASGGQRPGDSALANPDKASSAAFASIVEDALRAGSGSLSNQFYSASAGTGKPAQRQFAVYTYFAPWDWVMVANGYEDDFDPVIHQVTAAINHVVKWTALAGLIVAACGFFASHFLSRSISRPVIRIIGNLNEGTDETVIAAQHLTATSQSLAEGANEQAAALEESCSSLEEMAAVTKRNSDNASKANELAKSARTAADQSTRDIEQMNNAMKAIQAASDDIAKIIQTIDEIASQTNILALNAAVEAARAGAAGMGFAVVAGEVRNLAQRSAQAAQETATKIEGAIQSTTQGVAISGKVAQTLNEIAAKTREVDALVSQVATASQEQTNSIAQLNRAVAEIDKVTQSNAASAEESAAAAKQLNLRTAEEKRAVNELLQLVSGMNAEAAESNLPTGSPADPVPSRGIRPIGRSKQSAHF